MQGRRRRLQDLRDCERPSITVCAKACSACARSAASRASIARRRDCAATEVTIEAMTKSSTAAQISDGFVIVSE